MSKYEGKLLEEALVMLDIFNTSIELGKFPTVGSPLQKTLLGILKRGGHEATYSEIMKLLKC